MHVPGSSGQIIVADEEYFYIFNKRGFFVCTMDGEPPLFVHCVSAPREGNKVTWLVVGWTEAHLVVADVDTFYYKIPRHTKEFKKMSVDNYAVRYSPMLHYVLEDKEVPYVDSIQYGFRHTWSETKPLRDKEAKLQEIFSDCFRVRRVSTGNRYYREDKWMGKEASVVEGDGRVRDRDKIMVGGYDPLVPHSNPVKDRVKDRDKIKIGFDTFLPLPSEPANDVCFSIDGLRLHVLHQSGNVSIIDMD